MEFKPSLDRNDRINVESTDAKLRFIWVIKKLDTIQKLIEKIFKQN